MSQFPRLPPVSTQNQLSGQIQKNSSSLDGKIKDITAPLLSRGLAREYLDEIRLRSRSFQWSEGSLDTLIRDLNTLEKKIEILPPSQGESALQKNPEEGAKLTEEIVKRYLDAIWLSNLPRLPRGNSPSVAEGRWEVAEDSTLQNRLKSLITSLKSGITNRAKTSIEEVRLLEVACNLESLQREVEEQSTPSLFKEQGKLHELRSIFRNTPPKGSGNIFLFLHECLLKLKIFFATIMNESSDLKKYQAELKEISEESSPKNKEELSNEIRELSTHIQEALLRCCDIRFLKSERREIATHWNRSPNSRDRDSKISWIEALNKQMDSIEVAEGLPSNLKGQNELKSSPNELKRKIHQEIQEILLRQLEDQLQKIRGTEESSDSSFTQLEGIISKVDELLKESKDDNTSRIKALSLLFAMWVQIVVQQLNFKNKVLDASALLEDLRSNAQMIKSNPPADLLKEDLEEFLQDLDRLIVQVSDEIARP